MIINPFISPVYMLNFYLLSAAHCASRSHKREKSFSCSEHSNKELHGISYCKTCQVEFGLCHSIHPPNGEPVHRDGQDVNLPGVKVSPAIDSWTIRTDNAVVTSGQISFLVLDPKHPHFSSTPSRPSLVTTAG